MNRAYWRGYKIIEIAFRQNCADIVFLMSDWESPITGTGRQLVALDEIVIEEEEQ